MDENPIPERTQQWRSWIELLMGMSDDTGEVVSPQAEKEIALLEEMWALPAKQP